MNEPSHGLYHVYFTHVYFTADANELPRVARWNDCWLTVSTYPKDDAMTLPRGKQPVRWEGPLVVQAAGTQSDSPPVVPSPPGDARLPVAGGGPLDEIDARNKRTDDDYGAMLAEIAPAPAIASPPAEPAVRNDLPQSSVTLEHIRNVFAAWSSRGLNLREHRSAFLAEIENGSSSSPAARLELPTGPGEGPPQFRLWLSRVVDVAVSPKQAAVAWNDWQRWEPHVPENECSTSDMLRRIARLFENGSLKFTTQLEGFNESEWQSAISRRADLLEARGGWSKLSSGVEAELRREVERLKKAPKDWEITASLYADNGRQAARITDLESKLAEAERRLKIPHPARDMANEFNDLLAAKDRALAAAEQRATDLQAEVAKTFAAANYLLALVAPELTPADSTIGIIDQFNSHFAHLKTKADSFDAMWAVCVECGMKVHPPGEDEDGVVQPEEYAYQFAFIRELAALRSPVIEGDGDMPAGIFVERSEWNSYRIYASNGTRFRFFPGFRYLRVDPFFTDSARVTAGGGGE